LKIVQPLPAKSGRKSTPNYIVPAQNYNNRLILASGATGDAYAAGSFYAFTTIAISEPPTSAGSFND